MNRIDPNFMTTGERIGVVIRIDGAMSTRQPSTSSNTLISVRITYLSPDKLSMRYRRLAAEAAAGSGCGPKPNIARLISQRIR